MNPDHVCVEMRRILITIWFLVFSAAAAQAGEVVFRVQVSSNRISLQDHLQVEYLIENSRKVSQFIPPEFRNFDVVEGPEQTSGWNMENGVLKEYISFSYLLRPRAEGRFLIPQATARIDGRLYRTAPLVVEVVSALLPGLSEGKEFAADLLIRPGETAAEKIRNNIFVRLDLNRTSCYEGEPVVATYKLYTRLKSESKVTHRPAFNGFSVHDMAYPEAEEPARERYNGRVYNVYLLRKVQLYPLQAGRLQLDPVEVENTVTFVRAEAMKTSFDQSRIMNSLAEGLEDEALVREKLTLASAPMTVDVRSLPPAPKQDYTGAVGQFTLTADLSAREVYKGDVVNLVVSVSGKGNFPMMAPPRVDWPGDTEVFESSVQENFSKFVSPISGSKVYTFPFTPKREGVTEIPSVVLTYFDPATGKYREARASPIRLKVLPAVKKNEDQVPQTDVGVRGWGFGFWVWVVVALVLAAVGGSIYLLMRRMHLRTQRVVKAARQEIPAPVVVPGREDTLSGIRKAFEEGNSYLFYKQLGMVINECMSNKYQVKDFGNWEHVLKQKGVEEEMIQTIRQLKEDAALAMYTPFVMESKMVEDLARIEKMVSS